MAAIRGPPRRAVVSSAVSPGALPHIRRVGDARRESGVAWRSNTGIIAQGTTALMGIAYFTGGIRLEQNAGFLGAPRWSALPKA